GTMVASDMDRRECSAAGSQTVVNEDDGPTPQGNHRAIAAVPASPAVDLGALPCFDQRQLLLGHARGREHVAVEHPGASLSDRPHAQLGLREQTELANDEDVERCAER